jgi:hypothetical protein
LQLGVNLNGPYHGLIATYYHTKEAEMTNECTFVVGHFDGHSGALEQYRWHPLMRHVQGYTGSYWMPPLGNYSLRIAPATRATANKTMMKKWTNFACHFDGCGGTMVQYCANCPMEKVQGFDRSHCTLPLGKYCNQ